MICTVGFFDNSVFREYAFYGLCAIPADPKLKRPQGDWKKYQTRKPTEAELEVFEASNPSGVAIIGGRVSGNLVVFDFDQGGAAFEEWRAGLPQELIDCLVIARTQSGGYHAYFRCNDPATQKLAMRNGQTLIETRAEGALVIAPPSQGYEFIQGEPTCIPNVTDEERDLMLDVARGLGDETLKPKPTAKRSNYRPPMAKTIGERPGDDLNQVCGYQEVVSMLEGGGWSVSHEDHERVYLTRPGKDPSKGSSGNVLKSSSVFYCHSTNASPFEGKKEYAPFHVYTLLYHGGNWKEAARELGNRGYGSKAEQGRVSEQSNSSDILPPAQIPDDTRRISNQESHDSDEQNFMNSPADSKDNTMDKGQVTTPPEGVKLAEFAELDAPSGQELKVRRASDIPIEKIRWLWLNRIARGKITMVVGNPGDGKSFLTCELAAACTVGRAWPCGEGVAPKGSVLMLNIEDDAADTIVPRLAAAGADLDKVHVIDGIGTAGEDGFRIIDITHDLNPIKDFAESLGDVVLIVMDPITGITGTLDGNANNQVRSVLAMLKAWAEETGIAVVCISHLNKSDGPVAYKVLGSIGYSAASRAVHAVIRDPKDSERRILAPIKNNVGNDKTSVAYTLCSVPEYDTAKVVFEPLEVQGNCEDLLSPKHDEDTVVTEDRDLRIEWLISALQAGPLRVTDLKKAAKEGGWTWSKIERSRKRAGVGTRKVGYGAESYNEWWLEGFDHDDIVPDQPDDESENEQIEASEMIED